MTAFPVETILMAVLTYAATNIDDMLLLVLLFSGTERKRGITVGQYAGIVFLTVLSMLVSRGLMIVLSKHVWMLGFVPVALALRMLFSRSGAASSVPERTDALSVALLVIANGSDNIGVYVPLFSQYGPAELGVTASVFLVMTGLWCFAGEKISRQKGVEEILRRNGHAAVPAVFLLIGLSVIAGAL